MIKLIIVFKENEEGKVDVHGKCFGQKCTPKERLVMEEFHKPIKETVTRLARENRSMMVYREHDV